MTNPFLVSAAVFDSVMGTCDFSYSNNCVYVNSADNEFSWIQETITTTVNNFTTGQDTALDIPGHKSLSFPKNADFVVDLGTTKSVDVFKSTLITVPLQLGSNAGSTKRRSLVVSSPILRHQVHQLSRRSGNAKTTKTTIIVLSPTRVVSNQLFEVGAFIKHSSNNYIKFTFTASQGLGYVLVVYAHCLPDPPGHLDQVGSIDPVGQHKTFTISALSSSGSHTVCLNLRDSVSCHNFAMRFSASILHLKTQSARMTFTPKGVYYSAAEAGCRGINY